MRKNKSSISKAQSYEEMGEFWDTHDLEEYADQIHEVSFEVAIEQDIPAHSSVLNKADSTRAPIQSSRAIEIFCSYAHKDEKLRDELERHLSPLRREGKIKSWFDRMIEAGEEWKGKIDEHLNSANVILLLISSDFVHSDYCYDIEMARALERQGRGEARVIPIILRPCAWERTQFAHLQALPAGAKPVTSWPNQDEALLSAAQGIGKVVDELLTPSVSKAAPMAATTSAPLAVSL